MAQVKISKWEVAEMFGLVYVGMYPEFDGHEVYEFDFNGVAYNAYQDYFNCADEDEAKEQMAERVLKAIVKDIVI